MLTTKTGQRVVAAMCGVKGVQLGLALNAEWLGWIVSESSFLNRMSSKNMFDMVEWTSRQAQII